MERRKVAVIHGRPAESQDLRLRGLRGGGDSHLSFSEGGKAEAGLEPRSGCRAPPQAPLAVRTDFRKQLGVSALLLLPLNCILSKEFNFFILEMENVSA